MRISVITPVLNDWACLEHLLVELQSLDIVNLEISVHAIDDGSTEAFPASFEFGIGNGLEVLRLSTNMGHQRAIAVGITSVLERCKPDFLVVIDADGEDDPANVPLLIANCVEFPDCVVVAQRRERVASQSFRWMYGAYKVLFRSATGQQLDFGNFAVMTSQNAERLSAMSELWNHFPATIMKSRLPIRRIPLARRARFTGESRMNLVSLINHGLSGLSVFMDVVFTRMLILFSVLTAILGTVIVAGIVLRLSTDVPIPGWAALAITAAAIGLVQVLTALLVVGFLSLSSRAIYAPAPREFAEGLISERITFPQHTRDNLATSGD